MQRYEIPDRVKNQSYCSIRYCAVLGKLKVDIFPFAGTEYTADKIDVKEGFYLGHDAGSDHPDVLAGLPMVGANQYPDNDDIPGFTAITTAYMDHMTKIG